MAGEISVAGLSGGFDYNSILEKIQTLRSQQLYLAQTKQSQLETKKGVIQDIHNLLKNMKNLVTAFTDPALINSKSVSSSDENVLSASITDQTKVQAGTYQISVVQLAQNAVYASSKDDITSKDTAIAGLGNGTLTIKQKGLDFNIGYDSTYSLQTLADKINTEAQIYNGDFRASVVNVGTSSSPQYKIVISSTKTGTENDITITDSGNLVSTLQLGKVEAAQNARITVNGLVVERSTNQFNDVIEGMNFTAKRTGNVYVIVGEDVKPLKENLANLVNQYNSLVGKINTETSKGGKLAGEYGLNQLRSAIYRQLEDLVNADIIKFDRTSGTLSLNSSKLEEIYNNTSNTSLSGLIENRSELFSALSQIKTNLSRYLEETTVLGGTLDSMIKSYDKQIASLKDSMERMSSRIQMEMEVLKRQFIYMESIQAQYNAIGMRIQQTFGLNNKK